MWRRLLSLVIAQLLAGGTLARAETIQVGFSTNKPPYVFAKELRGLEIDLISAAAAKAGMTVLVQIAPMERAFHMMQNNELDAISTSNVNSGIPAFHSDTVLTYNNVAISLTARQLNIRRIEDLTRYSVSSFQRSRILLGPRYQAMASTNLRYHEEAEQYRRNLLLYGGRVDVVISDMRIFRFFNESPQVYGRVDVNQPITLHPIFEPTHYQVAFRSREQRDRFNAGLAALRASGAEQEITARYARYGSAPSQAEPKASASPD